MPLHLHAIEFRQNKPISMTPHLLCTDDDVNTPDNSLLNQNTNTRVSLPLAPRIEPANSRSTQKPRGARARDRRGDTKRWGGAASGAGGRSNAQVMKTGTWKQVGSSIVGRQVFCQSWNCPHRERPSASSCVTTWAGLSPTTSCPTCAAICFLRGVVASLELVPLGRVSIDRGTRGTTSLLIPIPTQKRRE